MNRTFVLALALVLSACAGSAPHGTENPANPRAATGASPPAYTSLASSDTPGIVPESSEPPTEEHVHGGHVAQPSLAPSDAPHAEHAHDMSPSGSPADDERAAFERARPVFEQYCSPCHTTRGPRHTAATLRHFSMDRYPFGGHHTATMGPTIREVLGASGEPATMPADHPGAVRGDELARVLAWADAWEHARGAVPPTSSPPPTTTSTPSHSHHHKLERSR